MQNRIKTEFHGIRTEVERFGPVIGNVINNTNRAWAQNASSDCKTCKRKVPTEKLYNLAEV